MAERRKRTSFEPTPVTVKIIGETGIRFYHVSTLDEALRDARKIMLDQYGNDGSYRPRDWRTIASTPFVAEVIVGGGDDEYHVDRRGFVHRVAS